tara:strand:- start:4339 stop:4584 length:246 start_codon:yes stop_codon:yes gene_type:complete
LPDDCFAPQSLTSAVHCHAPESSRSLISARRLSAAKRTCFAVAIRITLATFLSFTIFLVMTAIEHGRVDEDVYRSNYQWTP